SRAFRRLIRPPRGKRAAPGWASQSANAWSSSWAARSDSTIDPAAGPPSGSSCLCTQTENGNSTMPSRPLNRICYVEDDEDIQRIVRMTLERVGKMTVEVIGDPNRAMDGIAAFKPDLVMLDWMMPGMDG